jgi:hypothetical protein
MSAWISPIFSTLQLARANGATFVTCDASDFDKAPLHQLMDIDIIKTR